MTMFQILALAVLGPLFLLDLLAMARTRGRQLIYFIRCVVWLSASIMIIDPALSRYVAWFLGVGRGTDAILYLFILAFMITSFYFYSRYVRLQRQLTLLTRHLALQQAKKGSQGSTLQDLNAGT